MKFISNKKMKTSIPFRRQVNGMGKFLLLASSSAVTLTNNSTTTPLTTLINHIRLRATLSLTLSKQLTIANTRYTWLLKNPYKREGNIGIAYWFANQALTTKPEEYIANSNFQKSKVIIKNSSGQRVLSNQLMPGKWPGSNRPKIECTEFQILDYFLQTKPISPAPETMVLFTERFPCASCRSVIESFLQLRPNIFLHLHFEHTKIPEYYRSAAHLLVQRNKKNLSISSLMQGTLSP